MVSALRLLLVAAVFYAGPIFILTFFPLYNELWDQDNDDINGTTTTNCTVDYEDLAKWARQTHGFVFLSAFMGIFYATLLTVAITRLMNRYQQVADHA